MLLKLWALGESAVGGRDVREGSVGALAHQAADDGRADPPRVPSVTSATRRQPRYGPFIALSTTNKGSGFRSWAQLTAFFTSALILASSVAVNSVSAKEVGHMLPSSRFAAALKPNVAYRSLNFDAGVK